MKKLASPFLLIKKSWALFSDKKNLVDLIKIYSLTAILTLLPLLFVYVPFLSDFSRTKPGNVVMMIFNVLFILVMVFTNLCGIIALTKLVDGKSIKVKSVFSEALHKYFLFIFFELLISLIYGISFALLIIPFALTATWFNFSKFIVINEGRGIKFAFTESKKLVKGRFWQVMIRLIVIELFFFFSEMIISVALPYGIGMIIFRLCGALFLLPQVFLFKELVESKELQDIKVNG